MVLVFVVVAAVVVVSGCPWLLLVIAIGVVAAGVVAVLCGCCFCCCCYLCCCPCVCVVAVVAVVAVVVVVVVIVVATAVFVPCMRFAYSVLTVVVNVLAPDGAPSAFPRPPFFRCH